MATIATDDHHTLQEFRASVGAQWTFLEDPGRIVQKDLDIQEYTDPEHDRMIPPRSCSSPAWSSTASTTATGSGASVGQRPWHDLRAVSREIRPDWDLSAPGLREAWDAGDLSPFHGWNKPAAGSRTAAEARSSVATPSAGPVSS